MNIDERLELLEAAVGSMQTMLVHGAEGWGLILDAGETVGIPMTTKVFFADTIHEAICKAEEALLRHGIKGLKAGRA